MEAKVYNQKGEEVGTTTLPERIFGLKWNADLVHQVVTSIQANARKVIAHAKGRGEVSGGGKKPWKQKGTGRARHGSIRSPLWKGGGATHGPTKERVFTQKISKTMRRRALATVLSRKLRDGELVLVDRLRLSGPKTKQAQVVVNALAKIPGMHSLAYRKGKRGLLLLHRPDVEVGRSFRNIPSLMVEEIRNLNPVHALEYRYLLMVEPPSSLETLSKIL